MLKADLIVIAFATTPVKYLINCYVVGTFMVFNQIHYSGENLCFLRQVIFFMLQRITLDKGIYLSFSS